MAGMEILCSACGADALLRREPVYAGFKRTGERLLCAACGHEYPDEASVPFKRGAQTARVFTEADRSAPVTALTGDGPVRNCRHCRHYVVNPFLQRCAVHHREVAATDSCDRFERKEEAAG